MFWLCIYECKIDSRWFSWFTCVLKGLFLSINRFTLDDCYQQMNRGVSEICMCNLGTICMFVLYLFLIVWKLLAMNLEEFTVNFFKLFCLLPCLNIQKETKHFLEIERELNKCVLLSKDPSNDIRHENKIKINENL